MIFSPVLSSYWSQLDDSFRKSFQCLVVVIDGATGLFLINWNISYAFWPALLKWNDHSREIMKCLDSEPLDLNPFNKLDTVPASSFTATWFPDQQSWSLYLRCFEWILLFVSLKELELCDMIALDKGPLAWQFLELVARLSQSVMVIVEEFVI